MSSRIDDLPLFDPATRSGDPSTSKAAASSVRGVAASHKRILAMFRTYGDMTDETLKGYLDELADRAMAPKMSPSGARSRRGDLSKPNMDRLDQIANEYYSGVPGSGKVRFADIPDEATQNRVRHQLRSEGFRSPLWDTGKREKLSTGRMAIVWGIAK